MFAALDRGDVPAYLEYLSEDAVLRFGNNPPVVGHAAIKESLDGFYDTLRWVRHDRCRRDPCERGGEDGVGEAPVACRARGRAHRPLGLSHSVSEGYGERDVERLRAGSVADDDRPPFARDYDRLIYTPAFPRLQGKTQVVSPGEADFFRTRLTHTGTTPPIRPMLIRPPFDEISPEAFERLSRDLAERVCGLPAELYGAAGGPEDGLDFVLRSDGVVRVAPLPSSAKLQRSGRRETLRSRGSVASARDRLAQEPVRREIRAASGTHVVACVVTGCGSLGAEKCESPAFAGLS
jgi:hypothetical protein